MDEQRKREYVEAPAGHGKTESIAQQVVDSGDCKKRILILTHTNAGVNSLRKRLKTKAVKYSSYDLLTIDAFCLKYASYYPSTSGIAKHIEDFGSVNYKQAQKGAIEIFDKPDLKKFLKTKYSFLIVDEYQDCSKNQHELVLKISEEIDCLVFGDPMQGIFDFNSDGFSWEQDLYSNFTRHNHINLDIPHRWINSGNETLGLWIADAREKLKLDNADQIDFRELPRNISICSFATSSATFINDTATAISRVIPDEGSVLALVPNLRERNDLHHAIAGKMFRPLQSIDRMDSKKLMGFLKNMDTFMRSYRRKPASLYNLFRDELAMACMTGTPALQKSIKDKLDLYPHSIVELRKKGDRMGEKNKMVYDLLLDIYNDKTSHTTIKKSLKLMDYLEEQSDRIYRRELWYSAKEALRKYLKEDGMSLEECGFLGRQKLSFVGRNFRRVIGNTLLTKGLEFDHVIILDPSSFSNKNLYVALSRARNSITIIKSSPSVLEYAAALRGIDS
jgi:hypothetical protein